MGIIVASANSNDAGTDTTTKAEEEAQRLIAEQQRAQSDAKEEQVDPIDVQRTREEHGAEIAELDSKIDQLEKEMSESIEQLEMEMMEHIASVTTTCLLDFKENEFKGGMDEVTLRITQHGLHLQSMAEMLD